MGDFRMTMPTRAAIKVMLTDRAKRWNASEICREGAVPPGSIHALLARLERKGWIASEMEQIDESVEGRRARRLYWFTDNGAAQAQQALAESNERLRKPARSARSLRPTGEQT
jgi:DNA-binding PadR family transcriptional regulator